MKQIVCLIFILLFFQLRLFCQSLESRKKVEKSIILLKNTDNILPIINLDDINIKIRSNSIYNKILINSIKRYTKVNSKSLNKQIIRIEPVYSTAETLDTNINADEYKIFIVFGEGKKYLDKIYKLKNTKTIIYCSNEDSLSIDYIGQLIFGAFSINNKLTENLSNIYRVGDGLPLKGNIRFKYTIPQELGLDSSFIYNKIDSIVNFAISIKATPGCQIIAVKDQKVFFYKSYGYHTYDSILPVVDSNLYDLASITKIAASAPALMLLEEENKIDLNDKFCKYWPQFRFSNKRNLTLIDALCHQGKLTAWIPFWKDALDENGQLSSKYFSKDSTNKFPTKVADNLYIRKNYSKKIYNKIKKSDLLPVKKYKYSDLSFYIYPEIVKKLTHTDFNKFVYSNFYSKLGAYSLNFNPLNHFPKEAIIPTEIDNIFRKQLLDGTVHDEGAALLGGVSGHAGLFSNANDLAKLMQMYCNYGKYGGIRFLDSSIIQKWTTYQFPENKNRRAIAFDKLPLDQSINATPSYLASRSSFGHSGFTGTFAWADPETGLVFIFLSNRVFPTRNNKKLLKYNIRTEIHSVLYEAINESKKLK